MLGQAVAAEVVGRRDSHRRWLRLAPISDGVALLEVEVPVGVDPTEWPASSDYVPGSTETFESLDQAVESLTSRGIDTDSFEPIWKTVNPF